MLVSVVMPTYNCGRFIAESIESVLNQTMTDWELQIVDDCSTDDTYKIVSQYTSIYPNIHYYKLPQNSGPALARTEAIKRASGKYIAFLDSDDIWFPEKMEKQIAFMEENGAVFSCTAYLLMNENGEKLNTRCIPPARTNYQKMFYMADPIGNLTVMYDQELLGKYEVPRIQKRNDYALWLRILHDVDYCYGMPETLALYRLRSGSVSRNKLQLLKYQWYLYRRIEKMSIWKSGVGIICWGWMKTIGGRLVGRKG